MIQSNEIHLKMSSAKWRPLCLDLNVSSVAQTCDHLIAIHIIHHMYKGVILFEMTHRTHACVLKTFQLGSNYIHMHFHYPRQSPNWHGILSYVLILWVSLTYINHVISPKWKTTPLLTHWSRVTHICVSKLTIIDSDNGLSPSRRQAIIWTNAGILLIGPQETNLSEILIEIYTFSFKKIHLKLSSGKWRTFCLVPNVLRPLYEKAFLEGSTMLCWYILLIDLYISCYWQPGTPFN